MRGTPLSLYSSPFAGSSSAPAWWIPISRGPDLSGHGWGVPVGGGRVHNRAVVTIRLRYVTVRSAANRNGSATRCNDACNHEAHNQHDASRQEGFASGAAQISCRLSDPLRSVASLASFDLPPGFQTQGVTITITITVVITLRYVTLRSRARDY